MLKIDLGLPLISYLIPASSSSLLIGAQKLRINLALTACVFLNLVEINSYSSVSLYLRERSSSSLFMAYSPKRCASGAYIYKVSEAIFCCLSGLINWRVRMLSSLSASLIKITLTSSLSVRSIFLKFSACALVPGSNTPLIFVSPSTIFLALFPNPLSTSSSVKFVSSTVS